jgi:hypothetical protein
MTYPEIVNPGNVRGFHPLDGISGSQAMPTKHHSPEQIIAKRRQIDVFTAQGKSLAAACKEAGISGYWWYCRGRARFR